MCCSLEPLRVGVLVILGHLQSLGALGIARSSRLSAFNSPFTPSAPRSTRCACIVDHGSLDRASINECARATPRTAVSRSKLASAFLETTLSLRPPTARLPPEHSMRGKEVGFGLRARWRKKAHHGHLVMTRVDGGGTMSNPGV